MDEELKFLLNNFINTAKIKSDEEATPEDFIGKKVVINSYRVSGAVGHVTRYLSKTHHYWVWLDKPIKIKSGRKSNWHKCNAGNCRLFDPEKDIDKQLRLL